MTRAPDRWQRVRAVFDRALEHEPEAWDQVVASLAGDDHDLRAEVMELLAAYVRDGDLFERPAVAAVLGAVADTAPDESGRVRPALAPGIRIGNYRLRREIGQGGMGSVFEATRADDAYEKRVALKVIRRGMDSEHMIRRFRQERQILARLDHPNIARLLDGGVTEDGQPYFVMEYVEGRPIHDYCDAHRLSLVRRIALFRRVCDAVQYAHRNLVVHRDIKPSNILVTDEGEVKLLDFGVAKLVGTPEHEAGSSVTLAGGGRPLTPEYASPEQLTGAPVSTVSDVYSLGVVLYELLSGQRPYPLDGLSALEVARSLEREPTRPSDAVTDEAAAIRSGGGRQRLRRRLAGELDNIVLMALRREPERRYSSAEQLSEDLRRFLVGLPVRAQRDSGMYRARKFVRRHRAVLAALVLAIGSLLAAVVGTASQAHRARAQRAVAEQRLQDARELANALLFDVHDAIVDLPGSTAARALLVQRGIEYLDRLYRQSRGDPELTRDIAAAYFRLGLVRGHATGPSLGDYAGARENFEQARAIALELIAEDPADLAARRTLALTHEKLGDVEAWTGNVDDGVSHARAALEHWEALRAAQEGGEGTLPVVISRVKLADLLGNPNFPNVGDTDGSMEQYGAALALLDSMPAQAAGSWGTRRYRGLIFERLGSMHRLAGRYDEALAAYTRALAIRERLAGESPSQADARRDVGVMNQLLCHVSLERGSADDALPFCSKALEVYRELRAVDPENIQGMSDLAMGHRAMFEALAARGELLAARSELDRGTALLRDILRIQPDDVRAQRELARNLAARDQPPTRAGSR